MLSQQEDTYWETAVLIVRGYDEALGSFHWPSESTLQLLALLVGQQP